MKTKDKRPPVCKFVLYMTREEVDSLAGKDATFIVHACQNFESMLAALKEVHWLTQGPSMEKQDTVMVKVLQAISNAEKEVA